MPPAVAAARRRRLEPDARREQILDCAVKLFGERPYATVSTTEIADAAGVARGLLNHYFGTKRDLYVEVVRRLVTVPEGIDPGAVHGPLPIRVERSVDWFLGTVSAHAKTFVAVTGAEGVGADPEIEQILADADDAAARLVLQMVGVAADAPQNRAVVRAYAGLVKAAVREWVRGEALDRAQVHLLLSRALITIVTDVLPAMADETG